MLAKQLFDTVAHALAATHTDCFGIDHASITEECRIYVKYPPTILQRIQRMQTCTPTLDDIIHTTTQEDRVCPCTEITSTPHDPLYADRYIDRHTGHVRTIDTNVMQCYTSGRTDNHIHNMCHMMAEGSDFRPQPTPEELHDNMNEFAQNLSNLLQRMLRGRGCKTVDEDEIMGAITTFITTEKLIPLFEKILRSRQREQRKRERTRNPPLEHEIWNPSWHANIGKCIRHLSGILHIGIADKFPKIFVIQCKHLYNSVVYKRLCSQGEMEHIPESIATAHERVCHQIKELAHTVNSDQRFPRIYATTKVHKIINLEHLLTTTNTTSTTTEGEIRVRKESLEKIQGPHVYRFITAATATPVKVHTHTLLLILNMIDTHYCPMCENTVNLWQGFVGQRFRMQFVATDITEILANLPEKIYNLYKGDHSRMYETLPHEGPHGIRTALLWKFDLVMKYLRRNAFWINRRTGTVIMKNTISKQIQQTESYVRIDRLEFNNIITCVLTFAIAQFADSLFIQKLGIPMGYEVSPKISKWYFDYHDYMFVMMLLKNKRFKDVIAFSGMNRVADDICCTNGGNFRNLIDNWATREPNINIWQFLTLNDEITHVYTHPTHGPIGTRITMCDVDIQTNPDTGEYTFRLYDKARNMGKMSSKIIKYPKARSCIGVKTIHAVYMGSLHYIYERSYCKEVFIQEVCRLTLRVIWNGWHPKIFDYEKRLRSFQPRPHHYIHWQYNEQTRSEAVEAIEHTQSTIAFLPTTMAKDIKQGATNTTLEQILQLTFSRYRITNQTDIEPEAQ